ncbi:hypothetical protein [Sulfobacillus sp. hq2]|uniref:hypothetical protein n=1 Tax=Sulfobacillus TaxID=28033 RepID=UPI000CD2F00F|nr:hypothetical protein [Sulfobacillus sp. hq2]POB11158.1 hypothetical protein CO251_06350 [Sulfobacillus sp. hq2]
MYYILDKNGWLDPDVWVLPEHQANSAKDGPFAEIQEKDINRQRDADVNPLWEQGVVLSIEGIAVTAATQPRVNA